VVVVVVVVHKSGILQSPFVMFPLVPQGYVQEPLFLTTSSIIFVDNIKIVHDVKFRNTLPRCRLTLVPYGVGELVIL
jgi:hypothetical protein